MLGDSRTVMLNNPNFGKYQSMNLGLSGARISTLMTYTRYQIPYFVPGLDAIVLNIGINNAPITQTDTEFLSFAGDYLQLVEALQGFGLPVILSTIVPYETASPNMASNTLTQPALTYAPIIANFNAAIASIAVAQKCPLVDLAAFTSREDGTSLTGMTVDGTHYSASGSAIILALLNNGVMETLG